MEEERRLCYVGVTRAENKLYMLCARSRMLYGDRMMNKPSRFLTEMELIEDEGDSPMYRMRYGTFGAGAYSHVRETRPQQRSSSYKSASKPVSDRPSASPGFGSAHSQTGFGFGQAVPSPASPAKAQGKLLAGSQYKPNQRVVHDKFGRGVIMEVSGSGNTATITVDFEKVGMKRLAAAYVTMRLDENDE